MHRIIFVIAVFLFSLSSVMGQMIPVNLPADGNWPTIVGDSIMIIGPRQNELTEEQRYFNPVYLMVYPGKEHLAAQIIRAGLCDCDPTKPNRRIGVFSVAPNKQVSFSQGNLQYLPAINLWKFANTQYEYLGNANKYLKPTFRNWVDLFGWSANNTTAPFGVSTSTNVADYAGDFVDWGTNTICGDAPGTWRTLSIEEWKYLYHERKHAEKLFALGTINGIAGMILLPDDWQLPEGATCQLPTEKGLLWDDNYNGGGYINTNTQANHYQDNIYTLEQWQVMEEAGAVFLPAAGYRENTNFSTQSVNPPSDYVGSYATSTIADKNNYYFMRFIHREVRKYAHSLYRGRAVRLVHDTIVPQTILDPCLVVKVNDTLSINMMCVEGGTFTMGDDNTSNASPAHQVTLSDYYIGQTEVTQALWKAVMGNVPTGNKNPSYPVGYVSYADCQDFIVKLNKLTSLHFQLPTEAEWEYAAMGGNRSHGYIYSGSNTIDDVAWYDQNSGNKLHHVGAKQPNELGIYDMSGNAWEWCADYHGKYTAENQINPQGPATGTDRVIRSGSFRTTADRCTNKHRQAREADYPDSHITLRLVLHDTVPEPPKRIGVFSVAADKQVSFSQGNLQYIQSTKTWQFANNQLEYMGHKHFRNGQLADTIEYFGWSGKDSKAPWGISLSTESSDYEGEFLDWGTNTIAGSAPNTWRTLSNDEWLYICQGRKNADQLLGLGKISSIFGLIILPDDWVAPEGITFTPNDNNPNANVYSLQQWTAMEEAGAIFIPPTGYFNHDIDNMRYVGTYGYARNNTLTANGLQIYTLFKPSEIQYSRSAQGNNGNLYYAFPQRLVHDTIVPKPEPEYVDLGLSVKWATFNVGASKPEDYGDYFAWGETETKDKYNWATYKWCAGTSTNMTKYNTEDGKTILEPADDAAQVHWGGKWRMPSKEEVDELTQQCNWIWTTHNNVNGYKVTGPNGNSIFLPAAGYKGAGPTYPAGEDGLYWTSTLEKGHYSYLIVLHNDAPPTEASTKGTRCFGFAVRPVYDNRPPKRIGVFSVAADKQVSFSQGNLQYTQSTDTWQFAKEQYEYIGAANINDGKLADRIDLFGWSASGNNAPFGASTSTNAADYAGEFVDWGVNTISGDAPDTWRTLSKEEWEYLLNGRENAEQLRTKGSVEGKEGVILLPDNWICPEGYTIAIIPDEANLQPNVNTYSQADWSKLEDAGAIILPSAGMRRNTTELEVRHLNIFGGYWTCTNKDEHNSYCYTFHTQDCEYVDYSNHIYGRSVRLVHDTIVPETIPDPCLVVKVNDTLSINMMCVEGGTFIMGAGANEHQVTLSDYTIGQTEVTQALWEAVMGTNPSANTANKQLPVTNISWYDCQAFINKLNQQTGLRFRLPTEAEWEYAARGGQRSKGYTYAGSNDINDVAWYVGNAGAKSHIVGTKLPNELGIFDMSGNIWEWCAETFDENDDGKEEGAVHGGAWDSQTSTCRVISSRAIRAITYAVKFIGFRLVHDADFTQSPEPEYVDLGLSVK